MPRRITVYLTDELDAAVTATQLKPAELLWRGVEAVRSPTDEDFRLTPEQATEVEAALQARPRPPLRRDTTVECGHPRARRQKGLCMACGTHVGDVK